MQRRAEKLSGVTFQPLGDRRPRGASCFGLICKLLHGVCVQPLLNMCPQFQVEDCSSVAVGGVSVNSASPRCCNVQVIITNLVGKLKRGKTLQTFSRSFIAQAHHIFHKLSSDLKPQGWESGWLVVLKARQRLLAPYRLSDIHTTT